MRILVLLLLTLGCAKQPPKVAWWIYCDASLNSPADRVGQLLGTTHYFATPIPGELYGCIEAPPTSQKSLFRVVYSVRLVDLKKDDIVFYAAYGEVTNDTYVDDLMLGKYLVLGDTRTSVDGIIIRQPTATNCIPSVHHCPLDTTGSFIVVNDTPEIYLNFVVYANGGSMIGSKLIVEPAYGGLQGYIVRRAE